MSAPKFPMFDPNLDLKLERAVDLTPAQMYKAFTTPELLMKWFCPKPWNVTECELDLRPGGTFYTMMTSPEGQNFPNSGCFLELVPDKKIVWTDLMATDYRPTEKPFITVILTFEANSNGTSYTAIAKHKNAADKKTHEDMGFAIGWNTALDQLITLMKNQ